MREHLLTVFEVAARTRAHPETVRRWVRAGRLPAVKLGRRLLIDPADLERVLRVGLAAATPPSRPAPTYPAGNWAGGDAPATRGGGDGDGGELAYHRLPAELRQPRIIG